jgi:hypothetical protein
MQSERVSRDRCLKCRNDAWWAIIQFHEFHQTVFDFIFYCVIGNRSGIKKPYCIVRIIQAISDYREAIKITRRVSLIISCPGRLPVLFIKRQFLFFLESFFFCCFRWFGGYSFFSLFECLLKQEIHFRNGLFFIFELGAVCLTANLKVSVCIYLCS